MDHGEWDEEIPNKYRCFAWWVTGDLPHVCATHRFSSDTQTEAHVCWCDEENPPAVIP